MTATLQALRRRVAELETARPGAPVQVYRAIQQVGEREPEFATDTDGNEVRYSDIRGSAGALVIIRRIVAPAGAAEDRA